MGLGMALAAMWSGIGIIAAVSGGRARRPAVSLALGLGGAVMLLAFAAWRFWPALSALVPTQLAPWTDPTLDAAYVVVHGHAFLQIGVLLAVLAGLSIWLQRKAAPRVWQIARLALWLVFGVIAAQTTLGLAIAPESLWLDSTFAARVNLTHRGLSSLAVLALMTVALCGGWTLWHSRTRRA